MLKKLYVAYFSPTGGTKKAALYLAAGLAEQVQEIDLSLPNEQRHSFTSDDTVLFAAPVFGGRIPGTVLSRIQACQGNQTSAITAVVYGNRAYEDALLELNDCLQALHFQVQASAALICEHSMAPTVAAGRPDEKDRLQLIDYGQQISEKLKHGSVDVPLSIPGNRPYVDWTPMPVVPLVSNICTSCGLCAEQCPTGAIPSAHPQTTDAASCMLCMRCIHLCPANARTLPSPVQQMLAQKLAPLQKIRRENELFL